MKKVFTGIFALLLISLISQAQQSQGSSELMILSQSELSFQKVLAGASSVRLEGMMNYQNGSNNQQRVDVRNTENQIQLIQEGNMNTMDFQLLGERNNYQLIQQGNQNTMQVRNVQANNNTLQIVQRGNGNQLIDHGSGFMSRPIRIEQSGGMKLIINGN